MKKSSQDLDDLEVKLNRETAQIRWAELQKFFAQGRVIWVDPALDLIAVAKLVANDDSAAVKSLMEAKQLGAVADERAAEWFERDQQVWAVVSAPYVLVQEPSSPNDE